MDTHTQITRKVTAYRLHFVRCGFWFCGIQTWMLVHLTTLDLSAFHCTYMYMHIYVCMYIYIFSFLAITSMLRLNIIVQERGKNQTLRRNTAAQGTLVSAVVSPSAFLSESIWAPGAQQQEEQRCGLHPLNLATQTPDRGYRKSISPCQTGVRDRTWKPQITKVFPLSGQLKQTQTNKSNSES